MAVALVFFSGILLGCTPTVDGLRVLLIPAPAGGHYGPFVGLAEELDKQGHEVFTLTPDEPKLRVPAALDAPPNRTTLKLQKGEKSFWENAPEELFQKYVYRQVDIAEISNNLIQFLVPVQRFMLMENEVLLERMEKLNFDLAVVDNLFLFRFFYLIPHRLGIPTIALTHVVEGLNLRVPLPPSFVPEHNLNKSDKMTFLERLENLLTTILTYFITVGPPLPNDIKDKYLEYGQFESVDELSRRSLLWLHVVDPVLDLPSPSVPAIVKVGALSASATLKPLEGSIRDFVQGADHGLILMTFGSFMTHLPEDKAIKFIAALQQLKERVIWKFDNRDNLDIPENVLLSSWVPQKELLAHPSTRLFITHGGSGGQHEAITYGVPMVSFPLFAEQPHNAARAQRRGYSITMDIHSFTSDELLVNIRTILDDPGYRKKTQKAAEIIKERRQSPAELAVYWIDHVMKHGGYLRHRALDMDLYQVLMFDLFLFLAFCALFFVLVVSCCIRFLIRRYRKVKVD